MRKILWVMILATVLLLFLSYWAWQILRENDGSSRLLLDWGLGDEMTRAALVVTQREPCPGAPFVLPTDGFIGLLFGDPRGPYSSSAPHQGIDIFSNSPPGGSPVYAAYDGYISREDNWISALIQRVPQDPLQPERQIWLFYTHMADRNGNSFIEPVFSPGRREIFVEKGTLLGYTGDYNGNSPRTIWVHLHFSIIEDDGRGQYKNELEFANTIDPSPYFGRALNYACGAAITSCTADPVCGG
ncbi:MAG: M23 family metallopeptidase [Chloroflexota bacterium]